MLFAELNIISENGKKYTGAYLSGIATVPAERGKGYAGKLIEYTLKNLGDIDIYYLIPASNSLFDYYKKFGYSIFPFLCFLSCHGLRADPLTYLYSTHHEPVQSVHLNGVPAK